MTFAQAPAAPRPEFEVASIKPTGPDHRGSSIGSKGPGRFDAENIPIRTFIAEAYGVKTFEIYGAPSWLSSDKYDVTAKTEVSAQPGRQSFEAMLADMRLRLQSLLEDRCALKVHRETKELPVYALTVVKSGIKVKTPNCVTFDINNRPPPPEPGQAPPAYCDSLQVSGGRASSTMNATGITMKDLVRWLSNNLSRTIIDKTGIRRKIRRHG